MFAKVYRTMTSGGQGGRRISRYTAGSRFQTDDFGKEKQGGGATVERNRCWKALFCFVFFGFWGTIIVLTKTSPKCYRRLLR